MTTAIGQNYHPKKNTISFDLIRHTFRLKKKIVNLEIGQTTTAVRMAPDSFKYKKCPDVLDKIVYPANTTDERPYQTIARYRSIINEHQYNFQRYPFSGALDDIETVLLGLDEFARRFDGQLVFTDKDISYEDAVHQAECGIGHLGNIHLFANNYLPTAVFSVVIDRHYERVLASSVQTMCEFIVDFVKGIAEALSCDEDVIRIFEFKKLKKDPRQTRMSFGLTTKNIQVTERYAKNLQVLIEQGFQTESVLRWIQPKAYYVQWKTLMSFFLVHIEDFDSDSNIDYHGTSHEGSVSCSGNSELFHIPLGYFSHGLNIAEKYPDDNQWFGNENVSTEWNHAFFGLDSNLQERKTKPGFYTQCIRNDPMKDEAGEQIDGVDQHIGIYVTTQCDTGLYPDQTIQFTVPPSATKLHLVFHCRVKPKSFTQHRKRRNPSMIWRVYKQNAIRPYRILLKEDEETRSSTTTA